MANVNNTLSYLFKKYVCTVSTSQNHFWHKKLKHQLILMLKFSIDSDSDFLAAWRFGTSFQCKCSSSRLILIQMSSLYEDFKNELNSDVQIWDINLDSNVQVFNWLWFRFSICVNIWNISWTLMFKFLIYSDSEFLFAWRFGILVGF